MQTDFKRDLTTLNSTQMIQKYIYSGLCSEIPDDKLFLLKAEVSEFFGVNFNDVILVGSAKLGFSIAPKKTYNKFNDGSDIDIAIVSSKLFQEIWETASLYAKTGAFWENKKTFFEYVSHGWMRPDKLPNEKTFEMTKNWWEFFEQISSSQKYGPYKIRCGLYQSWFFLEEYQKKAIENCIIQVKNENIGN